MSSTSIVPSGSSQLKSFWQRPEGKTGMVVLGGLAVAGGLVLWSKILPFLILMVTDTLHLAFVAAGLIAFLMVVTNHRFRYSVGLGFRLLMRALTGWFITIDPIGILKEHLLALKKRRETMGEQISNVSGQIRFLKDTIASNEQQANQNMRYAEKAKQMASSATDQQKAFELGLQMRAKANKAGRLTKSNMSYTQLLGKLQRIYDILTKWATHIDFFIEDTEDQVKQNQIQYKTLNAAYNAYRTALAVIRGNADEDEIYNSTMEFLAEDAGRKLGEMEDFQRVAQNFMDTIDIQNGVVEDDALKKLDDYEHKLLTEGNQDTAFLLPGASAAPVAVAAKQGGNSSSDYSGLFGK